LTQGFKANSKTQNISKGLFISTVKIEPVDIEYLAGYTPMMKSDFLT